MTTQDKIIEKLVKEISENRAKIIDDFGKAYLAFRWDYFGKQKKADIFKRLELVMRQEGNKTIYFFKIKKGKLKK